MVKKIRKKATCKIKITKKLLVLIPITLFQPTITVTKCYQHMNILMICKAITEEI